MAYRGVSVNGTNVPVTSASVNPARSVIVEQSFGSAGEANIFDGGVVTSGNFEGAWRKGHTVDFIRDVIKVMDGSISSLPYKTIVIGDESGGVSFASCAINSFEFSLNLKDYAKVSYGFVSSATATSGSISSTTTGYDVNIPISTISQISCSAAGTKFSGFTMKGEIPLDQDYYVFGQKNLKDLMQNGNGSLSGSLTLAASEWDGLIAAASACGGLGTITVVLNTASASDSCQSTEVATITITNATIESGSASGQGRSRFDKTINWKAPVSTTLNKNNEMITET